MLTLSRRVSFVLVFVVLFGTVSPNVCRCEECQCRKGTAPVQEQPTATVEKTCCKPLEPVIDKEAKSCCGQSDSPCPCQCCDGTKSDALPPQAVLSMQKQKLLPAWDAVLVLTAGFSDVSELSVHYVHYRAMPPPVPLHVLLCVFLN
jgi:hypothetical protein